MRTTINSVPIRVFKPEYVPTSYPVSQVDDNGNEILVHRVIPDSDINTVSYDDLSLRSLVNAGVDPAKMHVDTTLSSPRVSSVADAANDLSVFDFGDDVTPDNNN